MFVVLTDSRCGSHMLRSLLNSHPQLNCYDEILGNKQDDKNFWKLGKYEGCLVSYANLIEGGRFAKHGYGIPRIVAKIKESQVIHLTRDVTERAKSQLVHGRASKHLKIFKAANLEEPAYVSPKYENFNPEDVLTGGGIIGGTMSRMAPTIAWTMPLPSWRPCMASPNTFDLPPHHWT